MKIENSFEVPAPAEAAWELLNDIPRVVPCMPGAELDEIVDEDTFKVTMKVKLGAISLKMATVVKRESSDPATGTTVMSADARDQKGRGGAKAMITSSLEAAGEGTRVNVETDIQMRGALASMGRGVVGAVASELVDRFAKELARELEENPPDRSSGTKAVGGFGLVASALTRRGGGSGESKQEEQA